MSLRNNSPSTNTKLFRTELNGNEILSVLREMRESMAACFRIMGECGDETLPIKLQSELHALGIAPGFAVRCQDLISKLEAFVPRGPEVN